MKRTPVSHRSPFPSPTRNAETVSPLPPLHLDSDDDAGARSLSLGRSKDGRGDAADAGSVSSQDISSPPAAGEAISTTGSVH